MLTLAYGVQSECEMSLLGGRWHSILHIAKKD